MCNAKNLQPTTDDNEMRASNSTRFRFWEHKDYKGAYIDVTNSITFCQWISPDRILRGPWDDSIDSMDLFCDFRNTYNNKCVVTIWRGCSYTEQNRSFELTRDNPSKKLRYFKDIHFQVGFLSWKNWHDNVSSISIKYY